MARLDYRTEKRRWEAEQALLASAYSDPPEGEEDEYEDEDEGSRVAGAGAGAGSDSGINSASCTSSDYTTLGHPRSQNQDLPRQLDSQHHPTIEQVEAEEALRRENEELEALIEMMEGQRLPPPMYPLLQQQQQQQDDRSSVFGSDDDEYDSIFMDMIDDQRGKPSRHGHAGGIDVDLDGDMDMS